MKIVSQQVDYDFERSTYNRDVFQVSLTVEVSGKTITTTFFASHPSDRGRFSYEGREYVRREAIQRAHLYCRRDIMRQIEKELFQDSSSIV